MRLLTPIVAIALFVIGCGGRPARMGVLTDTVGVSKTRLGASPEDVPGRQFLSPTSLRRARRADVTGDERPEVMVEAGGGRGIEIRDLVGNRLSLIAATGYLTDFGAVPASEGGKQNLVLYTYPNESGGGTFTIMTADERQVARWDEDPAPARFAVGLWNDMAALFYLQGDVLVVRSPSGAPLARLTAPQGSRFETVQVGRMAGGLTIVLASGSGYTPYHMICVYDRGGELVYQEVRDEHAFALEADAEQPAFVVVTRSSRWRYQAQPETR